MKSGKPGSATLGVEVTDIAPAGIWLLVDDREHFLSYDQFPWFRNAPVSAVFNVARPGPDHLHWPDLDVDLHVESLADAKAYPLISKA